MTFIVGTGGQVVPESVVGTDGWSVQIEREGPIDPDFERALQFVAARYGFLITKPLTRIRLTNKRDEMEGAAGLYDRQWGNEYSVIDICYHTATSDYVNTLVHELTHLKQHREGRIDSMSRMKREAEAEDAGHAAAREWGTSHG